MCLKCRSLDQFFGYKHEKGKLDSRCDQGIFVGYDKNSPAYLVYYPETEKVQKHRLVKFTNKTRREKETQTVESYAEFEHENRSCGSCEPKDKEEEAQPDISVNSQEVLNEQVEAEQAAAHVQNEVRRNPPRAKEKPACLSDFETEDTVDKLQTC